MFRKNVFLVLLILSVLFLAACGETTTPEKMDKTAGKTQSQAPPQTFKLGETVKMGELAITVHSKRIAKGGEFIRPAQGNVWLIAEATIENLGNKAAAISSLMMFKLADAQGYNYNVTIGPDLKGQLDGELAPGRKMRGEVAFEIPADATGLELIFEPNIFGFGQAMFKL